MMRMESLNVSAQSGTDQAAQQPTPTVPSVPTGLPPRSSAQSPNGKARFAAAANAIRFSNALLKKRQAPARPLQRYPSLGQLPVTRGASVTLSKNDSLDGPMAGTSFEHPEAAQGRWENVLMQYGGMTALAASYCAALMVGARIPAPSATAEKFLTHDLMKSIGIEKPGDRARVLLAIRRMPPVVEAEAADEDESVAEMFRTSRAAGKAKALGRVSKTYSSDRSHVQCMSTNRGDQFGATWFDLVGNDSTEKTDDQNGHQYGAALQSLINSFARTARGLRPTLDPLEAVPPPGTAADDVPMLTVENSIGEVKKNSTQAKYVTPPTTSLSQQTEGSGASHGFREVDNVWDPLVQAGNYSAATVAVERDAPHRVAFSFRVCRSLSEVEGCEADAICCRWHVVVDTQQRRIASVHEIDSVALATLRDHEALEGEVFNLADAFAAIVSAVLIETELVLDECSELLDECETKILLYDRHTLLIHSLFQLERRSAVYVRVIDVNQSVVADASRACALTRDFASLEAVWNRLRSKATNISTRSRRQLSLVLDLSGHRTNNLMSALTKPSVIFIPITFVTGVYGMRFENMPELHYENSYFVLWGLFLAAAVIGLFVTWRL